jgi:tRNA dimethylallyltransferase
VLELPPRVLVLCGATATGKSAVAMAIAKRVSSVILSADSRQVYKYLDIGTNKPTREDQHCVPHYLLDLYHPSEATSAFDYSQQARRHITELWWQQTRPLLILVGGSGMWIQALFAGFSEELGVTPSHIRQRVKEEIAHNGKTWLLEQVRRYDPITFERVTDNNPARLARALEVFYTHGRTLSEIQATPKNTFAADICSVHICQPRQQLVQTIENRTQWMFSNGIIEETENVITVHGVKPTAQSISGIGYLQALDVLNGDCTISQAIAQTSVATRQYAKRQRTWFRAQQHNVETTGSIESMVDETMYWLQNHNWLDASL